MFFYLGKELAEFFFLFSVKNQTVNILGFVSYIISVTTFHVCHRSNESPSPNKTLFIKAGRQESPGWWRRKTLDSLPYRCSKITTICRATLNEKDLRLAEKIFYNLRYKKQIITKQVEEIQIQYSRDTYPRVHNPKTGR